MSLLRDNQRFGMPSDLHHSGPNGTARLRLGSTVRQLLAVVLLALALGGAAVARADSGGPSPTVSGGSGAIVPTASGPRGTPFNVPGMWIWYVSRSSGGDPAQIIAKAQAYGIGTVFIKSADGTSPWSQFTPQLVSQLRAGGLNVCAWQYVYGNHPETEARLGAQAKTLGAQCLVIDAETEYEGRYYQAQRYITVLRSIVGRTWPVGLAGFPYNDYHPAFPYSVFLGPGGAQVNMPQMYWKAIGQSVDRVFLHTYIDNPLYGRAIAPLGQTYDRTAMRDIVRFRSLAAAHNALGESYWDWQEASGSNWKALIQPLPLGAGPAPASPLPVLSRGGKGDVVVWAQQHLIGAGYKLRASGVIDGATVTAINAFRTGHGLQPNGRIDAELWPILLRVRAAVVKYAAPKAKKASVRAASAGGAQPIPLSADLRARRDELAGAPH